MSKAYGLPGLRIGWIACRDRTAPRQARTRQALHVDLQLRAERDPRADRHCAPATACSNATAGSSRTNLPLFAEFFDRYPDLFEFDRPARWLRLPIRATSARTASKRCAQALVEQAGVLLLPSSIYSSALTETPTDRFRVGLGRLDPGPALACLGELAGTPMKLPIFGLDEISQVVKPAVVFEAVRSALIAHAEGRTSVPASAQAWFRRTTTYRWAQYCATELRVRRSPSPISPASERPTLRSRGRSSASCSSRTSAAS